MEKESVIDLKKGDMQEVMSLYERDFFDLLECARKVLKQNFCEKEIQLSFLVSLKTGKCPEDCKYCAQSMHYRTKIEEQSFLDFDEVVRRAEKAKKLGADRFCMSTSGRQLSPSDLQKILPIIRAVKKIGLETCLTMGMLTEDQAEQLKEAGLDFYNHNIDTSPRYYQEIVTTRTFEDRLQTLKIVKKAKIKVCCGGIVGMGETREDRAQMLLVLASMDPHPQSVPINQLVPIKGTPLEKVQTIDSFELVRTIAIARILLPKTMIRLAAGRDHMSDELQSLCFFAGVNSIFYGEKLLTVDNVMPQKDKKLLNSLGLIPKSVKKSFES